MPPVKEGACAGCGVSATVGAEVGAAVGRGVGGAHHEQVLQAVAGSVGAAVAITVCPEVFWL